MEERHAGPQVRGRMAQPRVQRGAIRRRRRSVRCP
jgi:hypothetical protein